MKSIAHVYTPKGFKTLLVAYWISIANPRGGVGAASVETLRLSIVSSISPGHGFTVLAYFARRGGVGSVFCVPFAIDMLNMMNAKQG